MVEHSSAQTERGGAEVLRVADRFGDEPILGRNYIDRGREQAPETRRRHDAASKTQGHILNKKVSRAAILN